VGDVRKLRFFSTIRTKFALTYFAVVAIVLVLMNTYFLMASRDMIFSTKEGYVTRVASLIASHLEDTFDALSVEDEERLVAVVTQLDVGGGANVVITDAEGIALYDPFSSTSHQWFPVEFIEMALEGNDVFYTQFSDGVFSSSAFAPIMSGGAAIGVVYVQDEDRDLGAVMVEMQDRVRTISIVVAIISVVTVALIVWSLMRRLQKIIQAIKSVREGQYSYHIKIRGSDELALLGDEFNSLTTKLRETDEIRRRFVADASHELKTPLASIRLLSDSILQNEDIERETVQEFISDIGMEAERLSRTTGKLMTLTRLDSHVQDENTRVNMRKAVVATLRMLKPLAESKGLTLTSELGDGCYVYATEDAVHQVIFNLIENAIKYNKPDGIVAVRLKVDGKIVVLTIDDRGVGVPDEDLPYLFNRFYRVDKARAREAGGSGLGLSIVQDTVRELGGTVTAAKRVGGGMRFQVRFELYDEENIKRNRIRSPELRRRTTDR